MKTRSLRPIAGLATLFGILGCATAVLAEYPVAGTAPNQRPAGAPVIQKSEKSTDWYGHALTGVSKPYPDSLSFLENQGNWYTPFSHPGMLEPYDIRGWHASN